MAVGSYEADGQDLFLVIIEEANTSEQSQLGKDIARGASEGAGEKSTDVDARNLEAVLKFIYLICLKI